MGLFIARNIQFTDKKHPFKGILSTIIGSISFITIIALFISAGKARGNGGEIYGYLGTVNMFVSAAGFIMGIRCYRMEDIFILFPTIGTVLNGLISVFLMFLYILGMN